MVETATKLPIKTDTKSPAPAPSGEPWQPLVDLRREIDRLFEDFGGGTWLAPFRPINVEPLFRNAGWSSPAVDFTEKDNAFEITAELPGLEAKDIEVTLRNGNIVFKGEKQEEREEKSKDYYLKERRYGGFERSFALPDGVDTAKIDATFKNGVLAVRMPKTAEARKPARKVEIKAA